MFIRSITADKVHAAQLGRNNWERGEAGWGGGGRGEGTGAGGRERRRAKGRTPCRNGGVPRLLRIPSACFLSRMRFFDVAISGSLINGRRQSTYRSGNAQRQSCDKATGGIMGFRVRFRASDLPAISRVNANCDIAMQTMYRSTICNNKFAPLTIPRVPRKGPRHGSGPLSRTEWDRDATRRAPSFFVPFSLVIKQLIVQLFHSGAT